MVWFDVKIWNVCDVVVFSGNDVMGVGNIVSSVDTIIGS